MHGLSTTAQRRLVRHWRQSAGSAGSSSVSSMSSAVVVEEEGLRRLAYGGGCFVWPEYGGGCAAVVCVDGLLRG